MNDMPRLDAGSKNSTVLELLSKVEMSEHHTSEVVQTRTTHICKNVIC
jgi:hypothetical protein